MKLPMHRLGTHVARLITVGLILTDLTGQAGAQTTRPTDSSRIELDVNKTLWLNYFYTGSKGVLGCEDIGRLTNYWSRLSPESRDDVPKFLDICIRAGRISPGVVQKAKVIIEQIEGQRREEADFVSRVKALARNPQLQTDKAIAAMQNEWQLGGSGDPAVRAAAEQLEAMRAALDARECPLHAKRAGVPAALLSAMYLFEWNSPLTFVGIACTAARSGAQFRYLSAGLLSKEGFEIKGASTVKVSLTRQSMSDGNVLLIPVESTINGKTAATTRANLQVLSSHIRSAVNNE